MIHVHSEVRRPTHVDESADGHPPDDGSAVSTAPPTYNPAPPTPAAQRPADTDPTKVLCVAVHLDPELRESILHSFAADPQKAWGPTPHLDLVAVVRHARQARRSEFLRDFLLAAALVATLGTVGLRVVHRGAAQQFLVVVAVIAALAIVVSLARRAERPWRRLLGFIGRRFRSNGPVTTILFFVFVGLIVAALTTFARDRAVQHDLIMVAAGIGFSFAVVLVHEYVRVGRALTAYKTKEPLREQAPSRPGWFEDRLAELEDANLVVYDNRGRTLDTFIGSGKPLGSWPITVDVTRGRRTDNGRVAPSSLSAKEIYDQLKQVADRSGIPDLTTGYRLYVDGRAARDMGLLTGPLGPPVARVPWETVEAGLNARTPRARTYLVVQIASWSGALVLTVFISVELAGELLHLQIKAYVLPGIALPRPAVMALLPGSAARRAWAPIPRAARSTVRLLLASPAHCATALSIPGRDQGLRRAQRRKARHDLIFEFGATESLHERYAAKVTGHANALDDLGRHFFVLESLLTRRFEQILEEHHIDTFGLRDAVLSILNNQHNAIDNLTHKNVSFGANPSS